MLARFFKHTRRQSKHVRDRYALGLASGFMLIVVSLWIFLPGSGSQDPEISNEEVYKPFATLLDTVGGQFASVRDSIADSTGDIAGLTEDGGEEGSSEELDASTKPLLRATTSIKLTPEEITKINRERSSVDGANYHQSGADETESTNQAREIILIATTSSQVATTGATTIEE